MVNLPASYTSASAFPAKLLRKGGELTSSFRPYHLQLILTNRCQLNCPYCSCKERNWKEEMSWETFLRVLKTFSAMGTKAVTITGGGEPLLYPRFDEVLRRLYDQDIEVGVVTNGIRIHHHAPGPIQGASWIRVSMDKYRREIPTIPKELKVAFSYVYQDGSEKDSKLYELIRRAGDGEITHLRIVSDILQDDAVMKLPSALPPNVLVQDRTSYTRGTERCWIALVKPVVDVDGKMYPCCGAQYAIRDTEHFPERLCMGEVEGFCGMVEGQVPFDGSVCRKCYYSSYNALLDAFVTSRDVECEEFI